MSTVAATPPVAAFGDRFPSLAALRTAYSEMLRRHRADPDSPGMLAAIEDLIRRGVATGALLDADSDRYAAQSLLDYWVAVLYRAGLEPPEAALAEFDPELSPTLPDELCPYRGLDAFDEADHVRFFGRQRLLEKLIGRLEREGRRLLAVLGPSGSGKSSLVRAGLVPALRAGALPGGEGWRFLPPMVPGTDPLAALARAIRPPGADAEDWERRQVEGFRGDAGHLARLIGEAGATPAVLVVDQFEEVFTLVADEAARLAFADNLLGLTETPGPRHLVILTMRSDYLDWIPKLPRFQVPFEAGQELVTPLNAGELREAIERPAELVGLKFEEGVVEALLRDILGEPAALPLLQFTLLKLWDARDHNRVTREAYRRLGNARLALARSADALFEEQLSPQSQTTARRILLRMVRPGDGLEVTSNRIRCVTLLEMGEADERIKEVLETLRRARLVRVTKADPAAGAAIDWSPASADQVEVAHEALIRNWPQLVKWLEEEREALTRRQRWEARASEWVRLGRGDAGLLDEVQAREAERWLDSTEALLVGYDPGLPAYVQASRAAVDRAAREKQEAERHQREQAIALEAEKRYAKRLGKLLIALTVATLFALGSAVFALREMAKAKQAEDQAVASAKSEADQRKRAERAVQAEAEQTRKAKEAATIAEEAKTRAEDAATKATKSEGRANAAQAEVKKQALIATSQRLAAQAVSHYGDQLDVALLLGLEAYRVHDTVEARGSVLGGLASSPHLTRYLCGHSSDVHAVAFSPDGKVLASCGKQGQIFLWEVEKRSPPRMIFDGDTKFTSLAFSPLGKTLVAGGEDGRVIRWDLSDLGSILKSSPPDKPRDVTEPFERWRQVLGQCAEPVQGLAFTHDGGTLAAANAGGGVDLWDVAGRRWLPSLPRTGPRTRLWSVAFSPDDRMLATGAGSGQVTLWASLTPRTAGQAARWGATERRLLGTLPGGHADRVWNVAFSPDGRTLASGSDDKSVILWDVPSRARMARLERHEGAVMSLAFNADGTRLATGSKDNTILLWDVARRQPIERLVGHKGEVWSVTFRADDHLASGGNDRAVILWDLATPHLLGTRLVTGEPSLISLAVRDERLLATGDANGAVVLWTTDADGRLRRLPMSGRHSKQVGGLTFSPDGRTVASRSDDGTVRLWDVATRQPRGRPLPHDAAVTAIAFSPDGQTLASGRYLYGSNAILLWDLATGRLRGTLPGHTQPVRSLAFNRDGLLASGDQDGRIFFWDVAHQRATGPSLEPQHTSVVTCLAFNADGQTLASGSYSNNILLWDVRARKPRGAVLTGHKDAVWSLALSHDGTRLASVGADGTMILWDVETRRPLGLPLKGHPGTVWDVAFRPDDRTALTCGGDGAVISWQVGLEAWRERVKEVVHRNLTREEWNEYLEAEVYRKTFDDLPEGTVIPTRDQMPSAPVANPS
jgi:WD40 repeat protein